MNLFKIILKEYLFVFLYLGLFFINSIQIIDRSAQYWLSLSVLNILLFIYNLSNNFFRKINIITVFKNKIVFFYLLFLFICILSLIFSYNISESFVVLFRYFTAFSTFVLLIFYLFDSSFKIFSLIISSVLLIQIYFTFSGYIDIISQTVYSFDFSIYLNGIGANKNISAALYSMQLPFLFFLSIYFRNYFLKLLFAFFLAFSFYNIFILGSRTVFVILFVQSVIIIFLIIFYSNKIKLLKTPVFSPLLTWFIPFIFSLSLFNSSVSSSNNSSLINRVSTIETSNGSVSERLKFYNYTIDYIKSNPFTPLGIGNWKIESVKWDSPLLKAYTVPYHAHNDFLELAAEISIFGALIYLLVFIYSALHLFKLINLSTNNYEFFFYLALLLSGTSFFIDSLFNFPNSRPIQVIILCFLFSYIIISKIKLRSHE